MTDFEFVEFFGEQECNYPSNSNQSESSVSRLSALLEILNAHNQSKDFKWSPKSLSIYIYDKQGKVVGGISGSTNSGWLHINILAVDSSLRGTGCGGKLLAMVESEAVNRGCHHAFLDTFSFQALDFYKKCGYEIFGSLEDFPIGHTRYYLKKALNSC